MQGTGPNNETIKLAIDALGRIASALREVVDEVETVLEPDDDIGDPSLFEPYLFFVYRGLALVVEYSISENALVLKQPGGMVMYHVATFNTVSESVKWPSISDPVRDTGNTSLKSQAFGIGDQLAA